MRVITTFWLSARAAKIWPLGMSSTAISLRLGLLYFEIDIPPRPHAGQNAGKKGTPTPLNAPPNNHRAAPTQHATTIGLPQQHARGGEEGCEARSPPREVHYVVFGCPFSRKLSVCS